jgi:hypothetical protein
VFNTQHDLRIFVVSAYALLCVDGAALAVGGTAILVESDSNDSKDYSVNP